MVSSHERHINQQVIDLFELAQAQEQALRVRYQLGDRLQFISDKLAALHDEVATLLAVPKETDSQPPWFRELAER